MPLTDTECKNATCPAGKTRARFSDAGGLYLEVAATGSKRWFWKYYLTGGTEKRLALGSYPSISLKAARLARDDARKIQQQGVDPAQQRRVEKLSRVFLHDSSELLVDLGGGLNLDPPNTTIVINVTTCRLGRPGCV